MENQKKVNLFIVGAMKAGTTSFTELLAQLPKIYVSPVKEPHFFVDSLPTNLYEPSRFFNLDNYLKKEFPKPLHITKIENEAQYEKIYSLAGNEKYRVDASTAYLHAPEAPERIYNYNPDSKIIVLLRDPLKRAFSHYKMNLGLGREKRKFSDALSEELNKYEKGMLPWNSYLGMSFYEESINAYKQRFNKVLILRFEDLAINNESSLREVSHFLNIDPFNNFLFAHQNKSRALRHQKLFYWLKQMGLKDLFSKLFSSTFKRKIFNIVSREEPMKMDLNPKLKTMLTNVFNIESPEWYS